MRRMSTRRLLVALTAAIGLTGCGGTSAPRPSDSPCHALGPVNDQIVATVGDARRWGPVVRGEHRYPGYAASDRLAVCLLPDGTVKGIFLKDGRQQVLWHQAPAAKLQFPI
jgi:hypothetical protein